MDEALEATMASGPTQLSDSKAIASTGDLSVLTTVPASAYTILAEHGRGGLGRILRARDERTGRIVAIKEMLGLDTEAIAARFVREALVTANLQHPAIVPVYEVGRWPDGKPFYAMKLVAGRTLSDAIGEASDRLALLSHIAAVADALAYAHGAGVIHRDLKPSNVLVGAFGETVVIDWGLAKRVGDDQDIPLPEIASQETMSGSVLGTPSYMPPEQATGGVSDERSDVYAIGAMLYHLLGGRAPYADAKNAAEVIARVKAGARPAPLGSDIAPDAVAIVDKAMQHDPQARYPSAAELAADLRAFMTGGFVGAHRYTQRQRMTRWIAKHRVPVAIAAISAVALGAFGAYSVVRVMSERDTAELAERKATDRLALSFEERARVELLAARPQRALPLVVEAMKLGRAALTTRFVAARAAEAMPVLVSERMRPLESAGFAPQGYDLFIVYPDSVVRWDTERDRVVWTQPIENAITMSSPPTEDVPLIVGAAQKLVMLDQRTGTVIGEVAWPSQSTPRGLRLENGLIAAVDAEGHVFAWDPQTLAPRASVMIGGSLYEPSISKDGTRIAISCLSFDPRAPTTIVDVATQKVVRELCPATAPCGIAEFLDTDDIVIARDPEDVAGNGWLALVGSDGTQKWEHSTQGPIADVHVVDTNLVVATKRGRLVAFDLKTGKSTWDRELGTTIGGISVGKDRIIARAEGGTFTVLSREGISLASYSIDASAWHPTFSNDGKLVAIVDYSAGVRVAKLDRAVDVTLGKPGKRVLRSRFSDDGSRLFIGQANGWVSAYSVATGALERTWEAHQGVPVTSLDLVGSRLMTAGPDKRAKIFDASSGEQRLVIETGGKVRTAALSTDGERIVTGDYDGVVRRWSASTGAPLGEPLELTSKLVGSGWSPDGTRVAAIDHDGYFAVWNHATGAKERELAGGEFGVGADLAWSPDGRHVAVARHDPKPMLVGVGGAPDIALAAEDGGNLHVYEVKFDRDGSRVAMGCLDGRVRIWDARTGARVATIETDDASAWSIAWSSDGTKLVTGSRSGAVRVWDVASGTELGARSVPGEIIGLNVAPRGDAIAIHSSDTGVLWRVPSWTDGIAPLEQRARCSSGWRLAGDVLIWRATDTRGCTSR